jgi:hypothetical protein
MTAKRDDDEAEGAAKRAEHVSEPATEVRHGKRRITATDAGWITPTAFVAPLTFVPVDPPRPIKKRRHRR